MRPSSDRFYPATRELDRNNAIHPRLLPRAAAPPPHVIANLLHEKLSTLLTLDRARPASWLRTLSQPSVRGKGSIGPLPAVQLRPTLARHALGVAVTRFCLAAAKLWDGSAEACPVINLLVACYITGWLKLWRVQGQRVCSVPCNGVSTYAILYNTLILQSAQRAKAESTGITLKQSIVTIEANIRVVLLPEPATMTGTTCPCDPKGAGVA